MESAPFIAAAVFGIEPGVFLHWMLAICLTLLVLDIFCNTEVISWVALVVLAIWGTLQFELPIQWLVLVFILLLLVAAGIYYTVWNHCVRRFFMQLLTRHAPLEAQEALVGKTGRILAQGDDMCVKVGDQLFPVDETCRHGLIAGDMVQISAFREAHACVRKLPL